MREKRVRVATIAEAVQRTFGAVTGRLQILRKKEKERRTSLGGGGGEFVFLSLFLSFFLFWEVCETSFVLMHEN